MRVDGPVRVVLDAGFVFWGLFLVSALIVVAYLAWMLLEDRREDEHR